MAAANFVPGSAFVKLYWALGSQLGMNVLAARVTGSPTFDQSLANSIGAAIKTAFTTNWAPRVPANVVLARVGVRDYRNPNLPEFRDTGATAAGTGVGDIVPHQVAHVVTLRTAKSGKSFRGRVYLSGCTETENTATGTASAAVGTSSTAFLQAIDTALQGQGLKLAVMSRPSERTTIVKTTFHNDGTTTTQTLSNVSAKAGGVESVTAFESRNLNWESQRRRANQRGALPTSLDVFSSLPATGV